MPGDIRLGLWQLATNLSTNQRGILLPCVFFCITGDPRCCWSNFCLVPYSILVSNIALVQNEYVTFSPSVSLHWSCVAHSSKDTSVQDRKKKTLSCPFQTWPDEILSACQTWNICVHILSDSVTFHFIWQCLSFSHFEDKMSGNERWNKHVPALYVVRFLN